MYETRVRKGQCYSNPFGDASPRTGQAGMQIGRQNIGQGTLHLLLPLGDFLIFRDNAEGQTIYSETTKENERCLRSVIRNLFLNEPV